MRVVREHSALHTLPAPLGGFRALGGRPFSPQPGGPLRIAGDRVAIQALLEENGIAAVISRNVCLIVGRSQAEEARRVLQHCGKGRTPSEGDWPAAASLATHAQRLANQCAHSFAEEIA